MQRGESHRNSATGEAARVLGPWSDRPSPGAAGATATGARELAYDPVRRMLWYAETHEAIRSVFVENGQPGPSLTSFSDVALPGSGVAGAARAVAIDLKRRRLIVPLLTGAVLFYDMDSLQPVDALAPAAFDDIVLGGFRHMVVDPRSGRLWYEAASGDLVEYDLDRHARTGRRVPAAAEDHAAANAYRDLAIDASRHLLVYQADGDRVGAVGLEPLAQVPLDVPALGFMRFAYNSGAG